MHLKSDLIIRVPSLDGDNLIVFYDLSAPEIWPYKNRAYERAVQPVHRYGTRRAKKGARESLKGLIALAIDVLFRFFSFIF